MPRTKGSKDRPKTTNDYASQITEKQEQIATLNSEIELIQKEIEEQKNTLRTKKAVFSARPPLQPSLLLRWLSDRRQLSWLPVYLIPFRLSSKLLSWFYVCSSAPQSLSG